MNKLKTIDNLHIKYATYSLAEFIKRVRENVPNDLPNEEVQLDFEIETYDDYDPFGGERYTITESELLIKIEDKDNG
jgi:hypothetical protein